ncbi:MAG: hypothetical protein QOG72_2129 [Sphingomonadales bacterium]|jgi:hypothetical protein|nr:hypothetical protein [Sphingomonadales bacterium]
MVKKPIFILVALAAPAAAQDADFARFVAQTNAATPPPATAEIAAGALVVLKAIAAEKKDCVPSAVAMEPPQTATSVRLATELIGAGKIKNAWTAYGRPQGCPAPAPTRFLVLRMADASLIVRVVNVGETIANPSLMRDSSFVAAVAAVTAIQKAKPECDGKDLDMVGTRVISKSADLSPDWHGSRYAGSWTEGWTFGACGRRAEVPITFTADGQGGANWNVRANDAKLVD